MAVNEISKCEKCWYYSIAADPSLADKVRYPTTVAFGANDITSTTKSLKEITDQYNWRTLIVLCDAQKANPSNAFFVIQCANTKAIFSHAADNYNLYQTNFDSSTMKDFNKLLERVKNTTRSKNHIRIMRF